MSRLIGSELFFWKTIYEISQMPIIKQTYIFVILIPIAANLAGSAQGIIINIIEIGGFSITIPVFVPSSWYLLFFSSLSFLFGRVITTLFCPKLISHDGTYSDYLKSGKGYLGLNEYIVIYNKYFEKDDFANIKNEIESKIQNTAANLYHDYYKIQNALNIYLSPIRYFAMALFISGFSLLLLLIAQKTISVIATI